MPPANSSVTQAQTKCELTSNKQHLQKKSDKNTGPKVTTWKMTTFDVIWCFLGIAVCAFTVYIFSQVNEIRSI